MTFKEKSPNCDIFVNVTELCNHQQYVTLVMPTDM